MSITKVHLSTLDTTGASDGDVIKFTEGNVTFSTGSSEVAFADITSKPTTVSGYGITDAQATLVSGTNIKTIDGESLLGSGDITVGGGAVTVHNVASTNDFVDVDTSGNTDGSLHFLRNQNQ